MYKRTMYIVHVNLCVLLHVHVYEVCQHIIFYVVYKTVSEAVCYNI